jgi:hypothetical protein
MSAFTKTHGLDFNDLIEFRVAGKNIKGSGPYGGLSTTQGVKVR